MSDTLPKLLYITAQAPFDSVPFAGHKIAAHHFNELRRNHRMVALIISTECDQRRLDELRLAKNVEAAVFVKVSKTAKLLAIIRNVLTIPPRYSTRLTFGAKKALRNLLVEHSFSYVWFEFTQVLPLISETTAIQSTAIVHDLQIQVALRGGWLDRFYAGAVAAYEKKIIGKPNEVFVLSKKDQILSEILYGITAKIKPPIYCDYSDVAFYRKNNNGHKKKLIFWGNLSRSENEGAIWDFIQDHLPQIRNAVPEVELIVMGASPSARLIKLSHPSIKVTGYVADPTPYFRDATIAVAPLKAGAGVKIKILELLSAGILTLTTSVGCEGIDANPLLICSDYGDFSKKIIEILRKDCNISKH